MIAIMRAIALECSSQVDRTVKVCAKLDPAGVMILAERRDDSDCAAYLISWEQLTQGNTEAARQGVRIAAKRARGR